MKPSPPSPVLTPSNTKLANQALNLLASIHQKDIGETGIRMLLTIQLGELNQPTQIAQHLGLTASSIGERSKILIKRGLIRKVRQSHDDRYVTYIITPKGTDLVREILSKLDASTLGK